MFTVSKSQVSLIGTKLIGEASTMGLAPGDWPDFIAVLDEQNTGFLFQKGRAEKVGGDLVSYNYFSKQGGELVVIND